MIPSIEQTAALLTIGCLPPDTTEELLGVLNGLTNDDYLPALREYHQPELCLNQTLECHLKEANAQDSVNEVQTCTRLLDTIFSKRHINQNRLSIIRTFK